MNLLTPIVRLLLRHPVGGSFYVKPVGGNYLRVLSTQDADYHTEVMLHPLEASLVCSLHNLGICDVPRINWFLDALDRVHPEVYTEE